MSQLDVSDEEKLRPEYDLESLRGGVRGKHYASYQAKNNLALLAPEVRAAFPTDDAVNQALRGLMANDSPSSTPH